MKGIRLLRLRGSAFNQRTRLDGARYPLRIQSRNLASVATVDIDTPEASAPAELSENLLTSLPSPPVQASQTSAKLAALHARLNLPKRFPIESLARALVDSTADSDPRFNNQSFSTLGKDLLGYYTSEYLICQYPRLPLPVVYAAMYAYVGPRALAAMTKELGIQSAAEPGGEVDPGFLQFRHVPPQPQPLKLGLDMISSKTNAEDLDRKRVGWSQRTIISDEFGDLKLEAETETATETGVTLETASANFMRAMMGAVYLHAGRAAAKKFYRDHFMSRQLGVSNLFQFRVPTRDLSRLCAREGFAPPIARILSETGKASRHPVYVIGVFSGKEKLGEGAGSSKDEARTRASVAALKGWYLYSPQKWRLPSDTEEPNAMPWTPAMVDGGEVVA